jgi:hypothetical protein
LTKEKDPKRPSQIDVRIAWARELPNESIVEILNAALMTSRAERSATVRIVNELAHEIKFRLMHGKRKP